jgi:hypothetical protein
VTPLGAQLRGPRVIPVGTASLTGVVTEIGSGRPIPGALVRVSGDTPILRDPRHPAQGTPPSLSRVVLNDAEGRYTLRHLPAGPFFVVATRADFLPARYGQLVPDGPARPVRLRADETMRADLALVRAGVITGTVVDADGYPASRVRVAASILIPPDLGRGVLEHARTETDDRGVYRLFGLPPGDYTVTAARNSLASVTNQRVMADAGAIDSAVERGPRPPAAPGLPPTVIVTVGLPPPGPIVSTGYLPTYYPSVTRRAAAERVRVTGGEERRGIDIRLQSERSSMIRGIATLPFSPARPLQVALLVADSAGELTMLTSVRSAANGRFQFPDIEPGAYTLVAQTVSPAPPNPAARLPRAWGRLDVSVRPESTVDLRLETDAGRSVSGKLVYPSPRPAGTSPEIGIALRVASPTTYPVFSQPPTTVVRPDGTFELTGVAPGRYYLDIDSAAVASMEFDGRNLFGLPLEVEEDKDISGIQITMRE